MGHVACVEAFESSIICPQRVQQLVVRSDRARKLRASRLCCFSAAGRQRMNPSCCNAVAKASSVAEAQPNLDIELSEFVQLADELAELAGSITKKFFRYNMTNAFVHTARHR